MAASAYDPARKDDPSTRSLRELRDLLLKLHAKIREKISPRLPREEKPSESTEMVIIILNQSSPGLSAPRPPKPNRAGGEWIDELCEEIERKGRTGRKTA